MKDVLKKDFLREILGNKGRFLSIFFIVMLGAAFFAGIRSTGGDMKYSADQYYDAADLMDLRVLSTMGLTQDDLDAIAAVDGVELVQGGYTKEVLVNNGTNEYAVKVIAQTQDVNKLTVLEGREPQSADECVVDAAFLDNLGYEIGDQVQFLSGTEDSLEDTLGTDTYTIVGTGQLPYYMDLTRGVGTIGDGKLSGFFVVSPEAFELDYFTEAYVRVAGAEELNSYSDAYEDLVQKVEDRLEEISAAAEQRRYDEVSAEASEKIEDGKQQIQDAEQELADAKQELDDGKEKLDSSEKELADGKTKLDDAKKELADGKAKLSEAEQQLADARQELDSVKNQLDAAETQLADSLNELTEGAASLETARAQLDDTRSTLKTALEKLQSAETQLTDSRAQLDAAEMQLAGYKAQLSAAEAELSEKADQLAQAKNQLDEKQSELETNASLLENKKAQLASKKEELAAGREAYQTGQAQLGEQKQQLDSLKNQYDEVQAQESEVIRQLAEDPDNQELQQQLAALQAQMSVMESSISAGETAVAAAETQLADKKAQLEAGDAEVKAAEEQISAAEAALEEGKKQLEAGEAAYEAGLEQYESGLAAYQSGQVQYAAALEEYNSGKARYDAGVAEYNSGKAQYDEGMAAYRSGEAQYEQGLEKYTSGKAQYDAGLEEYTSGKAQYESGLSEYNEGAAEYASSLSEYQDGLQSYEQSEQKYEDGLAEYESGLEDWEKGSKEYEEAFAEAQPNLEDARQQVADAEEALADLEMPTWYVLDRDKISSCVSFGSDAERMDSLGNVFPVIFFLVAALVSLTAMTRMVEEQRQQIGTMKALGYGGGRIAAKYIGYALLATVAGAVIGMFIGEKILPLVIITAYGMLYTGLPSCYTPINWVQGSMAVLLSALCTGAATLAACFRKLREKPAELMRPETPGNGKRILLERITFLWRRLNFTQKSTMRNLFRYKKRFIMTIIGIGGCMGLMLVGFGIRDSITVVAENQFVEIFMQDASLTVDTKADDETITQLQNTITDCSGVTDSLFVSLNSVTLHANDTDRSASLYVPENVDQITDFVRFRDRTTKKSYDFPSEGVALSEKTADMLDVKVGDTITIQRGEEEEPVETKVTVIIENYVQHYAFATPETFEKLFGEEPEYNYIYVKYEDNSSAAETAFGSLVLDQDACTGISFTTDLEKQIDDMLQTLSLIIWVLIVSAALLAFVVLYNLNSINMTERKRELATLKVLGFYDPEVAMYVYRENIFLTLIGIAAGAVMGKILHLFTIMTVEVDLMMFGRVIGVKSYCICAVLTLVFSVAVNLIMYGHFKKIDMIESLKSVE